MKYIVRIVGLAILIAGFVLTSAAADKTLKVIQKFTKDANIGSSDDITFADVNGDGFKDIIARYNTKAPSKTVAGIWLWKGTKFSDSVDCSIDVGAVNGAYVTAGDLNGDGIADIAILSNWSSYNPPKIVFGRATWPKTITTPDLVCGWPQDPVFEPQGQYSSMVIADFNADGYGDLCYQIQGNDTAGTYAGLYGSMLAVYYGAAAMDSICDWIYKGGKAYTITGTSNVITPRYFSPWHMAVGDFNNDGYPDILTSGWNAYSSISMYNYKGAMQSMYNCGCGLIFLGGPEFAQDSIPDVILMASDKWLVYTTPAQYLWLGYAVYNAGDVNGDGIDDISLPGWYMDIELIFKGDQSWKRATSASEVLVVRDELQSYTKGRFDFAGYSDQSGVNLAGLGDINGDGLSDMGAIINQFGTSPEDQGISLFFGKEGKKGALKPDYKTGEYIKVMPGGLDVDHDGINEFFVQDQLNQLTLVKVNPVFISSVADVPFDQGGNVRLAFSATVDNDVAKYPYFSLWRALPTDVGSKPVTPVVPQITKDFAGKASFTSTVAGTTYRWEWVKNVPAELMMSYSSTVPTLFDSMGTTDGKHYFMVIAHTANPNMYYMSDIDSAYSVDNLAPLKPAGMAGAVAGNFGQLTWLPNTEKDLKHYLIYKSDSPNIPDGAPVYATVTVPTFTDGTELPATPVFYAVKAEDVHGNLSPKSDEVRISLVGVEITDTSIPTEFALHQNYPNPFNPATTIEYALKEAGMVTIRVMNVIGEEVATIESGFRPAGRYRVSFDATKLPSGIYLYQIRAGSFVDTKKMVLVK